MMSSHGVKRFTGRCLVGCVSLLAMPSLAQSTYVPTVAPPPSLTKAPAAPPAPVLVNAEMVINDLLSQIASQSRRLEQLLQEREALVARLASTGGQDANLARAVEHKDREVQDFVQRQGQLLSLAGAQGERLETLENGRRLFRFVVGAGVPVYRFPEFRLGASEPGTSPGRGGRVTGWEFDAFGGVAFLPVDLNSRDRRQTFSLGGMLGLGGNGFPGNLYAGLTFKVWVFYLNTGVNFRRATGGTAFSPTQSGFWQGPWTPAFFAGLSLDGEALLALQQVLPSKSSPEGLQVDPG
ncbi:hypothetical protein F0U60_23945 [Archangium minus]|uniref:Uncharacterized protein n=1 Tax=Archangium minus TaxID=83450 RepID=A0ABY9WUF0_9BACT|nr:hypothetical protein F0U60_23945 [Archangium minus]